MSESRPFLSRLIAIAMLSLLAACANLARPADDARVADQPEPSGAQLLQIADLLETQGDRVRADQYLTLAAQRGVDEREIVPRQLKLYAADGQYRLALDRANAYLRRHPSDRRVRRCLAAFYAAVGATAQSARAFETLLGDDPNDAAAHFALASLLEETGMERARADLHYRAYLALAPRGEHVEQARAGLLKELP